MAAANVFKSLERQLASGTTNDTLTFTRRVHNVYLLNMTAGKNLYAQVGVAPGLPSSSASVVIVPNVVYAFRTPRGGSGANRAMMKVRVKGTTTNTYNVWSD